MGGGELALALEQYERIEEVLGRLVSYAQLLFSADSTDATRRLRTTLLLVLGISLLAALAAALLTLRATRRIVQPIERLVKSAEAISMGDLAQPVRADRNDEIGDLAQALERMRLSLESAMERLRRRKRA